MSSTRRHEAGRHAALSVVMATGIVSVAAFEDGRRWVSIGLFAAASALFVLLGIRALGRREVTVESFAIVAATSVLGVRVDLAGQHVVAAALGALAAAGWVAVWLRLRGFGEPAGTRLLAVVATESVAFSLLVISKELAALALVPFLLGLALYAFLIATIPLTELRSGRGDAWIAMGALAISALAAADLGKSLRSGPLDAVAVLLLSAATLWGIVLVCFEARRRRLRYESRRWATVFPLGMYATASHAVDHVSGAAPFGTVSHVVLWLALAVWAAVSVGAVRDLYRRLRHGNGPISRAIPI